MLKNENHTQIQNRRNAIKSIRYTRFKIWGVLLLLISIFFLIQHLFFNKNVNQKIIDSCIENVPQTSNWKEQFPNLKTDNKSILLIKNYCHCMWDKPLKNLSDNQLNSIGELSATELLNLFGGKEQFTNLDNKCMSDTRKL